MANEEDGTPSSIGLGRLIKQIPRFQYISEFGFVEPFEALRTELFRITEDVTRTSKYR